MGNGIDALNPASDRPDGGPNPLPVDRAAASGSLVAGRLEDVGICVLSLKEVEGACYVTLIAHGFASILRFVYDRHDDLVLGAGSDEWPELADKEADAAHWYETLSLVSDFLCGTEGERRQINVRLAADYLAARAA